MITSSELIEFGGAVHEVLVAWRQTSPLAASTSSVYAVLEKEAGVDRQTVYNRLRALADGGYPGAKRGEPQTVTRFGKSITQRPWLWSLPDDPAAIGKWAADMETKPGKAGPYAAIEARLRALEARILVLEGAK